MTETPSPFVRAASKLAPSLLLLLSTTGVHAELTLYDVSIVSAPPITIDNEAQYTVSGDCTYTVGENPMVSVTLSDTVLGDVVVADIPCMDTGDMEKGEWSIEAADAVDITGFGSGLVDENGILVRDVAILAVYTNDTLAIASDDSSVKTHQVDVYRNVDAERLEPGLVISLAESRTVFGEEFQASTNCGANRIILDATGLLTVHDADCARMASPSNPDILDQTLAMIDPLTGASGACEFDTLTMNGAGDIRITVDPQATQRCLDDKDDDRILDMHDPEPGTGANNNLCVDSQHLRDNIALTDAELICAANVSITIQGVTLPDASDVCYEAGQFVRFAPPALASVDTGPVFAVPAGTAFHIPGNGGSPCGT